MVAPTWTTSADTAYSLAMQARLSEVQDNIFTETPFYDMLFQNGKSKEKAGTRIEVPFEYATNPNVGSIGKTGTVGKAYPDIALTGYVDWKTIYASLPVTHRDRDAAASTEEGFLDYVGTLTDNMKKSFTKESSRILFLDGTGNNGLDPNGIASYISTNPTTDTIYSVINRTTQDWARNKYRTAAGSVATYGNEYIDDMITQCSDGGSVPTLIITDKTTYGYFSNLQYSSQMNSAGTDPKVFQFGRPYLSFRGAVMIWDNDCPSGYSYVLNMNTWNVVHLKNEKMIYYPFEKLQLQFVSLTCMASTYQPICGNMRYNGVISGWTA